MIQADTRLLAHGAWSKKKELVFVSLDTDVLAILLLNNEYFSEKQLVIQSGDPRGRLDLSKLMIEMTNDGDTELTRVRNTGVSTPFIFGVIHTLIGTDILCSPRGFGPACIIKTCLDFATLLFDEKSGLQNAKDEESSRGAYIRYILALFKKKYSSKIKKQSEEILAPTTQFQEIVTEIQRETWVHTLESKSMLPSEECLNLREKNWRFQMKIWLQATKPQISVPDPEDCGWEKTDSGFVLQADSNDNIKKQKTIFDTIMRKCSCKSSKCITNRCGCKKNGSLCSSLCECINCENTGHTQRNPTQSTEGNDDCLDSDEDILTSDDDTDTDDDGDGESGGEES